MAEKLGIGARFPNMSIDCADGSRIELPAGLAGKYAVALFYRGHW